MITILRLILILLGVLSFSGLDMYLAKKHIIDLPPILLAIIFLLVLFAYNNANIIIVKSRILYTLILFFLIPLIHAIFFSDYVDYSTLLLPLFPLLVFIVVPSVIITNYDFKDDLLVIVVLSLLVIFSTTLVDAIFPGTFSKVMSRPAGININPNSTYIRTVALLFIVHSLKEYSVIRYMTLYTFISVVIVLLTLSRGGFLIIIISIFLLYKEQIRLKNSNFIKILFIIVPLLFSLNLAKELIPAFNNRGAINRIESIYGKGEMKIKEDARVSIAKLYFSEFLFNPIRGKGIGYTSNRTATHNLYLKYAVEMGLIGLLIIGMFYASFFTCKIDLLEKFIIILFIMGFFNNSLLDNRAVLYSIFIILGVSVKKRLYDY